MKYIYLYTTPTYKLKNWYKIGETVINPIERIKQQDNASNPEELMLITFWKVSPKITDKKVHNKLESLGFSKLRGNREWFELSEKPNEDVQSALSALGSDSFECDTTTPFLQNIPVLNYTEMWWFI